jgi:hypothetical protein
MTKQEFTNPDEADQLRMQLTRLLQEICATVAHQVRPEPLREAIALSQSALKSRRRDATS